MHKFSSCHLTDLPQCANMRQWNRLAVSQVMAWHLFGAKPLLEPMLHCQLSLCEQSSVKLKSKYKRSDSRKCTWKCRLWNGGHLSRGGGGGGGWRFRGDELRTIINWFFGFQVATQAWRRSQDCSSGSDVTVDLSMQTENKLKTTKRCLIHGPRSI